MHSAATSGYGGYGIPCYEKYPIVNLLKHHRLQINMRYFVLPHFHIFCHWAQWPVLTKDELED